MNTFLPDARIYSKTGDDECTLLASQRRKHMKKLVLIFAILLPCATAFSQPPSDRALLIMQESPALNFESVPNGLTFPTGVVMGLPGDLEFDSKGHLWVVSR